MRKLEKLTLKEVGQEMMIIPSAEAERLKGGMEYYVNYDGYWVYYANATYGSDGGVLAGSSDGVVIDSESVLIGHLFGSNQTSTQYTIGPSPEEQWAEANKAPWQVILGTAYLAACAAYAWYLKGTDFGYTVIDPQ